MIKLKIPTILKKRKNKIERSFIFKVIKFIFLCLIITLCIGVIACIYIYNLIKDDLSTNIQIGYDIVSEIDDTDFNTRYPTLIYDKDGNILKEFTTIDYIYKTYEEMNPEVFNALIAIEDERFYQHNGFDLKGFARGIYSTIVLGDTQGGSTITQQLVKNIYLTSETTIWRKVKEAVIAQELEKIYSKEQILEFYVNNVNYANGCYSIESASEYYFQKNTKELNIAEIAFLTSIPNNPSAYNPLTKFENTLSRKDIILKKMFDLGMLTKEEYNIEKNREIILNKKTIHFNNDVSDYAQSYAVHKAVEEIMRLNGFQFIYNFSNEEERKTYWDLYNEEYGNARSELISGGYEIYTCIDTKLQEELQNILNEEMSVYTSKDENTGLYKKQASLTVIDNKTGMVAGIIGGRTQKDVVNSYNRAYLSARQPGSTIKPIICYTPAFELGYLPSDKMVDKPIPNGPKNAGGGYSGTISLRYAVEKSTNTIAYNLCKIVTPKVGINKLATMKFRNLDYTDSESPIIAVGGFTYGMNTLEMSSAYATIARNGSYIQPTNIYKIVKRSNQEIVYENDYSEIQVYDEGAAYLMTDCMKGVLISGTGKRYRPNYKYTSAKTGTTNDSKDIWMCGSTPYYSIAIWVGNDTPVSQSGIYQQGTIFRRTMNHLHKGLEEIDFEKPSSITINDQGNLCYEIEQKENLKNQRVEDEINRKYNEIKKQEDRIALLDYELIYGLTPEEELAREKQALEYLNNYINYNLTSSSQFEEFDVFSVEVKNMIEKVKNKTIYSDYIETYNSYLDYYTELKESILYSEKVENENFWQQIIDKNETIENETTTTPSEEDTTIPSEENTTIPSEENTTTPSEEDVTTPSEEDTTTSSEEDVTTPSEENTTTSNENNVSSTNDGIVLYMEDNIDETN